MKRLMFLVCSMLLLNGGIDSEPQPENSPSSFCIKNETKDIFEVAVIIIKKYEGWHGKKHYPYVGYGHRLLPGEKFDHTISESFADSLVRKDLRQKCRVFRHMGKDYLMLGALAYNIGESRVLKSSLYRKLKSGNRDIYTEYISFRMYKGKAVASLERRRKEEYNLLFTL